MIRIFKSKKNPHTYKSYYFLSFHTDICGPSTCDETHICKGHGSTYDCDCKDGYEVNSDVSSKCDSKSDIYVYCMDFTCALFISRLYTVVLFVNIILTIYHYL